MIFVDTTLGKSFEQFAYTSRDNNVEYVSADTKLDCVDLLYDNGAELSEIYYEDIPKLILALQAAYDFKMKGEA